MGNLKHAISFIALTTLFLFFSCAEETIDEQSFGSLEGKVVSNGENSPLENVKITTNPTSTTVFTDSQGNFKIEDVVIGDYSVQAEKEDFQTGFEPATILTGKTTNVVFELDSTVAANLPPLVPILLSPEDG